MIGCLVLDSLTVDLRNTYDNIYLVVGTAAGSLGIPMSSVSVLDFCLVQPGMFTLGNSS